MEHEIIRRINGGPLKDVKTKLNKCPKCGGGGGFVQETFYVFGIVPIKTYHVQCLRCPHRSPSVPADNKDAKEKAVDQWNAGKDYYKELEAQRQKWQDAECQKPQDNILMSENLH